jgi:hypothetical protein
MAAADTAEVPWAPHIKLLMLNQDQLTSKLSLDEFDALLRTNPVCLKYPTNGLVCNTKAQPTSEKILPAQIPKWVLKPIAKLRNEYLAKDKVFKPLRNIVLELARGRVQHSDLILADDSPPYPGASTFLAAIAGFIVRSSSVG